MRVAARTERPIYATVRGAADRRLVILDMTGTSADGDTGGDGGEIADVDVLVERHVGEAEREHLGDAVATHCDAVECVGDLDGTPVVGDDDRLRLARKRAQFIAEANDVRLVERGVDLIEEQKWGRVDPEDGEEESDRGQRSLSTGEQCQSLQSLAGRLRDDIDAARSTGSALVAGG